MFDLVCYKISHELFVLVWTGILDVVSGQNEREFVAAFCHLYSDMTAFPTGPMSCSSRGGRCAVFVSTDEVKSFWARLLP